MARPVFWPTQDSYVMGFGGIPYAGVTVRVYAAQTGGTPLTDLQYVNAAGAPVGAIPGGVLVSDEHGLIPAFAGPDGGPTTVWGSHGLGGERLALTADPTGSGGGGGAVSSVVGQTGAVSGVQILADSAVAAALAAKAPIASPAFTGVPTVPTAAAGTSTTQAASTAFVMGQVGGGGAVSSVAGRTGAVVLAEADITNLVTDLAAKAPLASPALTGTPTAPTAAVDTSTTQLASTAYVLGQAASATPLIDGTAAVGTSTRYARGDHRHPTDTTRAAAATTVTAGTGLTGGGDLSANRTLAVSYGTGSGTAVQGNDSRVVNAVQSTTIATIVRLTQAAYDAIGAPAATTLYVIVG